MMNIPPIGSIVELIPGMDEVYRFALAGSRGTIGDHKVDDNGYPLVWVEWDKDHWRYNGEPDGWTFASHFTVLEEEPKLLVDPVKAAKERREEERCPHCGEEHDELVQQAEGYLDTVQKALNDAVEADGFFLITVNAGYRPEMPGVVTYSPRIFSASMMPEIVDVIQATIARMAQEEE